jgi:membrane protein DedA with SNARE-associated domain
MDVMFSDLVSILPTIALRAAGTPLLVEAWFAPTGMLAHTLDAIGAVTHVLQASASLAGSGVSAVAEGATTATGAAHEAANGAAAVGADTGGFKAWIEPYIKYGPWAIMIIFILCGVGLHLSEDLILIPAGVLIAHGQLDLTETLVAAYVGLVIGDVMWIAMCRRFGTRMVHSRWFKRIIHPRRLLEAKHQMELKGIMVVVLARFIPGTRTPVITMAGILHMKWWKLLVVEFTTCAITVPLQVGLGYLAAIGMGEAKSTGEFIIKLVVITAVFVLAGVVLHWWITSRKRKGRAPRSKANWLRTFGRRRRHAAVEAAVR